MEERNIERMRRKEGMREKYGKEGRRERNELRMKKSKNRQLIMLIERKKGIGKEWEERKEGGRRERKRDGEIVRK